MESKIRKKRRSLFDIIAHIAAIALITAVVYSLILALSCSVSDPGQAAAGQVLLWPKGFTLAGYEYIFHNKDILSGYANTVFYTVFGTLINLVVTIPAE